MLGTFLYVRYECDHLFIFSYDVSAKENYYGISKEDAQVEDI